MPARILHSICFGYRRDHCGEEQIHGLRRIKELLHEVFLVPGTVCTASDEPVNVLERGAIHDGGTYVAVELIADAPAPLGVFEDFTATFLAEAPPAWNSGLYAHVEITNDELEELALYEYVNAGLWLDK